VLCLEILFNFQCFYLFEEDSWDSLSLLSSSPVWSIHSFDLKHQRNCLPCPNQNSIKTRPHPRTQTCLSRFPTQNPQKTQITSLHFVPSLILAAISVISSPIDCPLLILTQREPSPVLIGLATRLSMVWYGPRSLPFQPEVNLGSNTWMHWWEDFYMFLSLWCPTNVAKEDNRDLEGPWGCKRITSKGNPRENIKKINTSNVEK